MMTVAELKERCKNREFDQIVVVVKDIFQKMSNMQKIQKNLPGTISIVTDNDVKITGSDGTCVEYVQKQASYYYANTEICFVEPVRGNTLYAQFLENCGEGICCIRESMTGSEADRMIEHLNEKGIFTAQCSENSKWFDLTGELGIIYELTTGERQEASLLRMDSRIAQINISTYCLEETIKKISDILEIGQWEVGHMSSSVTHDTLFAIDGGLKDQDYSYLLAILVCGNIEWEVIEPEVGELVYSPFVNRRKVGFHHILQEIPKDRWSEKLEEYSKAGISMNCQGSLGPVDFRYMETEKELGFYLEQRTDAVMDRLPDGYLQYYYPEY